MAEITIPDVEFVSDLTSIPNPTADTFARVLHHSDLRDEGRGLWRYNPDLFHPVRHGPHPDIDPGRHVYHPGTNTPNNQGRVEGTWELVDVPKLQHFGTIDDLDYDNAPHMNAYCKHVGRTYDVIGGGYRYPIDFGNKIYTTRSTVHIVQLRSPKITIRNVRIRAEFNIPDTPAVPQSGIVLNLVGTNRAILENIDIYSDQTHPAKIGIYLGRDGSNGAAGAGNHILENVRIYGYYTGVGLMNFASETMRCHSVDVENKHQALDNYAVAVCNNYDGVKTALGNQDLSIIYEGAELVPDATSNYSCTIIDLGDARCHRPTKLNLRVETISQANPAVVKINGQIPAADILDANTEVFFRSLSRAMSGELKGMKELENRVFRPAAINRSADTLELRDVADGSNPPKVNSTNFAPALLNRGFLHTPTGGALYLQGAQNVRWNSAYALTYNTAFVTIDFRYGSPCSDLELSFNGEFDPPSFVCVKTDPVDTTRNYSLDGMELKTGNVNMRLRNSGYVLEGEGTLKFNGGSTSVINMPPAPQLPPKDGFFDPAGRIELINHDVHLPIETVMNDLTAFAEPPTGIHRFDDTGTIKFLS